MKMMQTTEIPTSSYCKNGEEDEVGLCKEFEEEYYYPEYEENYYYDDQNYVEVEDWDEEMEADDTEPMDFSDLIELELRGDDCIVILE